jgi:iron complex transport system ATP-binding protein
MNSILSAHDLHVGYRGRTVVHNVNLSINAGQVLVLLGPNGSGKTTLFRTLMGLQRPVSGRIELAGKALSGWSRQEVARYIGYVPQSQPATLAYSVFDLVLMGRASRVGLFDAPGKQDRDIAWACIERLGIAHLAERLQTEISGGERQLALIARALTQEPKVLVMDEPTASLDFGNQIRILACIEALRDQGMGILMTTHQPEHALRVANQLALLRGGQLEGPGDVAVLATASSLASLYGVSEADIRAALPV